MPISPIHRATVGGSKISGSENSKHGKKSDAHSHSWSYSMYIVEGVLWLIYNQGEVLHSLYQCRTAVLCEEKQELSTYWNRRICDVKLRSIDRARLSYTRSCDRVVRMVFYWKES